MSETRKIAAILVSDVVGYSRLAAADEDRTLARLRALRSDLIDPTISVHHGHRNDEDEQVTQDLFERGQRLHSPPRAAASRAALSCELA